MQITGIESNAELLAEIGQRIRDTRIAVPLTRDELARKSGVSVRTIANMESGRSTTFLNVVSVLRALNLAGNLESLVPETGVRPADLARLGKKRERATAARVRFARDGGITWGDLANGKRHEAEAFVWEEDK